MTGVWEVRVRNSHLPGCSTLFNQRQLHPDMEQWYLDALRVGLSPRQVKELFEKFAWPVRDDTGWKVLHLRLSGCNCYRALFFSTITRS